MHDFIMLFGMMQDFLSKVLEVQADQLTVVWVVQVVTNASLKSVIVK